MTRPPRDRARPARPATRIDRLDDRRRPFQPGRRVLITRGTYRGATGRILERKPIENASGKHWLYRIALDGPALKGTPWLYRHSLHAAPEPTTEREDPTR